MKFSYKIAAQLRKYFPNHEEVKEGDIDNGHPTQELNFVSLQ